MLAPSAVPSVMKKPFWVGAKMLKMVFAFERHWYLVYDIRYIFLEAMLHYITCQLEEIAFGSE